MTDRKPVEHELKVLPQFYNGITSHRKTFEIRKDDRDYQVGDSILLREFDGDNYTGHQTRRKITYILRDAKEYGLADGYCILGIQPVGWDYIKPTAYNVDKVVEELENETHIYFNKNTDELVPLIEVIEIVKRGVSNESR